MSWMPAARMAWASSPAGASPPFAAASALYRPRSPGWYRRPPCRPLPALRPAVEELPHLAAESGLLHSQVLMRANSPPVRWSDPSPPRPPSFQADRRTEAPQGLLQFPFPGLRSRLGDDRAQFVGHARQHLEATLLVGRLLHRPGGQLAHGIDDEGREAPLPGDGQSEILEADAENPQRRLLLAQFPWPASRRISSLSSGK